MGREDPCDKKSHIWEGEFHVPFYSMIYFLLKIKSISEIGNCIQISMPNKS